MPQDRKRYEDNLYKKENIVAYTGDLNNNPTVYFLRDNGNGTETYGHITQTHEYDKINIGREEIATSDSYKLINKKDPTDNDKVKSYEFDDNKDKEKHFHKSRGPHVKVSQNDKKTLDILAQSIDKHPGLKKMNYVDYTVEQVQSIHKNDLEKQPNQLVDLYHELTGINGQLNEVYPDSAETTDKNISSLKTQVYEIHQKKENQIKKIQSRQNQKLKNNNKNQSSKPDMSKFNKASNNHKKLNNSQQTQLNNANNQSKNLKQNAKKRTKQQK